MIDELSTGTDELSVVDELSSTVVETLSDELSVAEEVVSEEISAEAAELVLSFVVLFEQPASKNAASAIANNFFIFITSFSIIAQIFRSVNNF